MNEFTHFDCGGNAVMVDVGGKEETRRCAVAKGVITLSNDTLDAVKNGGSKKGDVLGIARIAGIMAAKNTARLIPLCHTLIFDSCTIDFTMLEGQEGQKPRIEAVCTVKLSGRTGAEMEALTGVSIALLTIYDLCKALERGMVISDIWLEEKSGGKSGLWQRDAAARGS
ncbi:MAG: cyclic pyranopterin monophosphate synthase MoaC [Spirochaetaceae bacterium]|jgi:cyclic pyranopterin phosphate synthase|nr:cyclic pyranopterin monophosphate synthase MoaC [Spirochaetaceae bacterium]